MNCILNQNVLVTTLCSPELTLDLWVLSCFCTVVNNRTENYILRYQFILSNREHFHIAHLYVWGMFLKLATIDWGCNKEMTILENDILLFSSMYHKWCDYFSFKYFLMCMKHLFLKSCLNCVLNLRVLHLSDTSGDGRLQSSGQLTLDSDTLDFNVSSARLSKQCCFRFSSTKACF